MGKFTISMVIFHSYVTNYQRVKLMMVYNLMVFHNYIISFMIVFLIKSPIDDGWYMSIASIQRPLSDWRRFMVSIFQGHTKVQQMSCRLLRFLWKSKDNGNWLQCILEMWLAQWSQLPEKLVNGNYHRKFYEPFRYWNILKPQAVV